MIPYLSVWACGVTPHVLRDALAIHDMRCFALNGFDTLLVYQEETGHLYNYEATPAESTCYRFALADRKIYPDIVT